jgi:hypothetical protein
MKNLLQKKCINFNHLLAEEKLNENGDDCVEFQRRMSVKNDDGNNFLLFQNVHLDALQFSPFPSSYIRIIIFSTLVNLFFSLSINRSFVAFNLISRSFLLATMKQFDVRSAGFFRSFQGKLS